ncbi:hypothetical protein NDU88_007431 [Pleurodeles waltl]|uniref:Uncharacterized protein n=1 Tax=Pleurodeles waltl TaxID=8319 RepID=A0AAV7RRX4_PLEWA|nr:hypothetical protein NDU88_007431 [Pleurodeles waltl]
MEPHEERLRQMRGRIKPLEVRLRRTEGPVRDSLSDVRWNETRADRTENKLRDRTLGGARTDNDRCWQEEGGGERGEENRDKTAAKR